VLGTKSANAHLHWMEELTELYAETGDPDVSSALAEVADVLSTHFHPADPQKARSILTPEWAPVPGSEEPAISLGHNVEFAWLLLRVERVLGRPLSVDRLVSYVDHALETGFDTANGGLDTQPLAGSQPGHRERIWWVQAELLAALVEAVAHTTPTHPYEDVLRQHLAFIFARQTDPRDALWWETVDAHGVVTNRSKHHEWKAGYHELRALTLLSESG
jgi:mannose/cellobiose epimerase-like protein (N-acyl-D-glucosamine 2-epimerase family)